MKSLTAVCQTGASGMPALNASGRISRHPTHRGDGENAEMKMYLSKLKDLVPFMPKNRKLTKLEIIQHVIDYICDLQTELETHPEMGNFDAAAALTAVNGLHEDEDSDMEDADVEDADAETEVDADILAQRLAAEQPAKVSSPAARLPLADRQTPNTLVAPAHPQQQQLQQQQQQQLQLQQQQLQSQQQLSNSLATPLNAEKDSRQS
ncbi:protein extra-macrochaetae [Drosophila takahashii]|uniref:protein extra-macrochaetae n=1 Tax=Drosophila takahashii TaxID=29030 RepID=UPI003898D921